VTETAEVTVGDAIEAINDHLARTRLEWTPVTATTRLEDLELDSFEITGILLGLEESKGLRLSIEAVADAVLVEDLASAEQVEPAGPQGQAMREGEG
jgi:acyl carrier protein